MCHRNHLRIDTYLAGWLIIITKAISPGQDPCIAPELHCPLSCQHSGAWREPFVSISLNIDHFVHKNNGDTILFSSGFSAGCIFIGKWLCSRTSLTMFPLVQCFSDLKLVPYSSKWFQMVPNGSIWFLSCEGILLSQIQGWCHTLLPF